MNKVPAPTVLIIANPIEAKLVRRAVEGAGLRASVAEGGEGALERFDEDQPDLLVVSTGLYYADAPDLVRQLRARRVVPVVALGDGKLGTAVSAANAVVRRPIEASALLAVLLPLLPARTASGDEESWWTQEAPDAVKARAVETPAAPPRAPSAAHNAAPPPVTTDEAWWDEENPPVPQGQPLPLPSLHAPLAVAHAEDWYVEEVRPAGAAGSTEPSALGASVHRATLPLPPLFAPRGGAPGAVSAASAGSAPSSAGSGSARAHGPLLRADEALADFVLDDEMTRPASTTGRASAPSRRALDRELTSADRRLFAGPSAASPAAGSSSTGRATAARDTLGDLRLDSLGGLPGLDAELGLAPPPPSPSNWPGSETGARRPSEKRAAPESASPQPPPREASGGAAPSPTNRDLPAAAAASSIDGANGGFKPLQAETPLARLIAERAASLTKRVVPTARVVPELDAADPVAEAVDDVGDLAREPLPPLLVRLHRSGFTGRLVVRQGEGEKSIFFESGFPVYAASTLVHDRLGELLWREGRISRDQHARSRLLAEKNGLRLGEALIEINALKRDELFKMLRHQAEEIIYSTFGWDRGSWILGRELARRDEKISIAHPYAIALEGIRRKYSLERLVGAVGPVTTMVSATASVWRITADAGLSPMERQATQLLRRGAHAVSAIQQAGKLDEIGVYALVHGLIVLGAVVIGVEESVDGAQVNAEADAIVDRERALAKYGQVCNGDYFTILGVSRSASSYELRRGWERTKEEFAPDRFDRSVREELGEKLDEIREVVDEAWHALSDEKLREQYRSHLVG